MQLHMVEALKSNIPARSYLGWSEDKSSQSCFFFLSMNNCTNIFILQNLLTWRPYNVACFCMKNIDTHSIPFSKLILTVKKSFHLTKAFTNIFSPPFHNNIKTLFYIIYLSSVYFRRLVSMFNCCKYTEKSPVLN